MPYRLPDLRYQSQKRTPKNLLRHLNDFSLDLKFSVGIWYFTPSGSRFHVYKKLEKESGIKLVAVPFSHFFDKDFVFGSMSSPYPRVRKKAARIAMEGLKLVKASGARMAISWPGIDGYTYSLGTVFPWMWDWFEGGMAEAMDEVPGVRIALEPKPYEPAPNNIYRTTAEGILAGKRIEARLKNPVNRKLLEAGHTLFGLNPERIPVQKAVEINTTVLKIMNDRINSLPNEKILDCHLDPYQNRGSLELILAKMMRK
jgi:xylose isomerase